MTLRAMGVRYHPAVELVEVVAVAMKCVRVSRKTTQMQRCCIVFQNVSGLPTVSINTNR